MKLSVERCEKRGAAMSFDRAGFSRLWNGITGLPMAQLRLAARMTLMVVAMLTRMLAWYRPSVALQPVRAARWRE
jgi:hypothetical protein